MTVDFHVSGYCIADASIIDPTRKKQDVRFHAVWMHIVHEQYGHILVDTGYGQQFYDVTRSFPGKIYAWVTPVTITDDETAVAILAKKDVAPSDITYIIITHFHADHICALRDFPRAKYICSGDALAEATRLNSWRAVSKGIVKALLPEDFHKRVLLIEDIAATSGVVDGGIEVKSFFDESSIQFAYLPGHATGMVGLIIRNGEETIFYAADAQWDKAVFDAGILPKQIVKLFFSSWKDFLDTTRKLKLYMAANPATRLMFTHCEQTLKYVQCRLR